MFTRKARATLRQPFTRVTGAGVAEICVPPDFPVPPEHISPATPPEISVPLMN